MHRHTCAVLAVLAVLTATGVSTLGLPARTSSADSSIGLRVNGNQLSRDGYPFLPRGFNMIGLLAPAWCTTGQGPVAADRFGQAELDAAKGWNANTLRFQISQRGLADPAISQADRDAYLQRVVSGVQLARGNGFVVIVSMQDQSNGCGPAHPLPSALTASAWSVLAPAVMSDRDVMFELFNEPNVRNDTAGWLQWSAGGAGPTTNLGDTPIGHQALVDQIRSLGASNVIIADGLNKAGRLAGLPLLADATGQVMYAVHPYYLNTGTSWWDEQWGYLTATMPVIATEWNYLASACGTTNETLAQQLLPYLHDHRVGVLAHAFDVPGTTITRDWSWSPTDCASSEGGSGQLTKDYFAGQADEPAPLGICPVLTVLASAPTRVDISWESASGPVDSYRVMRDGVILTSTPGLGYSDTTVEPNHAYAYSVRAVDAHGNTGPMPPDVTVTTPPDQTPPTAPGQLTGTLLSPTRSRLSWVTSTDDVGVVGYRIVRDGATIAITSGASYADSAMPKSSTHVYSVRAVDQAGNVSPASKSVTIVAPGSAASGLTGKYYDTASFTSLKLTRVDATVDFNWGTAAPAPGMGVDTFSVRWTGRIIPRADEAYTFYTQSDDGVRLWVNGQQLIDGWTPHTSREDRATITLKATQAYTIRIDLRDNSGTSIARLSWSSPSVTKAVIPASQLLAQ